MLKKLKVIGTGMSGLVGTRIAELLGKKYSFTNLDLTTGVDLTLESNVTKAMGEAEGGVVLHLAAFTDVDAANSQQGDREGICYKLNVLGTRYVAQWCARTEKYLIHISTDFIFDGRKMSAYTEEDVPHPIEWYGRTKYLAEKEVQRAHVKYAILRIAFPFRTAYAQKTDLVRSILHGLENDTLYPMFSDQLITPTFIDDIATAVDSVISQKPQGIFHIVGSTSLSPYLLAKKIAKTFGFGQNQVKKGSLSEYLKNSRRPYQRRLSLSNRKAKTDLGIVMLDIDRALARLKSQIHTSTTQTKGR
ncbi:MAG: hypothetical protein A3A65_04620 [Candidatus Chisholmbacteria bacterium RIFCSPLOWO2_01_FULL_49_14]|uniref:dTDP-4-dehydrorhamnose reductase n=1 Tax=Candidatus Chisholmbacteria bacterium RIFCSPLOWO2_01_FULL_49_14 TaxID=1797593 RepID=A0A1G1W407_9BACT|nr:MAG: hypothetical protein A3A65_04620 [Candidatus Chisholmbacteria bacterium RIFCSPLOWO2_01_FULL_49_14]